MKVIPRHTIDYIHSWLELRWKWETIPGFSVAIAKDGEILLNQSYGYANMEKKEKLTPDHLFRIASHSKTFTATAIMQLQEQGLLRIDDPVVSYVPWLKKHKDDRWQKVTVRQLLSHSAGVIRDGSDAGYWGLHRPFPDDVQLQRALLEVDLIQEPNTKLKYSNYGYSLLGVVVHAASGQSYNDYVTKHIIEPLKLQSTFPEFDESSTKKFATGYSREDLRRRREAFPHISTNAMSAATGFCSTAADMATYFIAHQVGSGQLLTDESKREMQRVQWESTRDGESYGLGLDITKHYMRRLIGHSGGFPGFVTRSYIAPSDSLSVVVLSNCHGAWSSVIARAIYDLIDEFGDEAPKKDHLKYETRLSTPYGVTDVIAHANGIRRIYPNSWYPLDIVDTLTVHEDGVLRIDKTGSFDSEGELVKYTFDDDGNVASVLDSGSPAYPSLDGDLVVTWK